jgi:aspartyl-tRNA(Asn)/glutamyl-tRNA(Gln) amidotransferase subunit A
MKSAMDPLDLSLSQIADTLREGALSSRSLTETYARRAEKLDPILHAFLQLEAENALREAAMADERWAVSRKSGNGLGALNGIPIAVKDVLCVRGFRCTAGSRILEGFRPPYTATPVDRLQKSGALIMGKTNTDEFAMGSSTENSAYGPTHNPWDITRVPGGSSGGSAAAVAARMIPAALGSDTGGSIRQPAAYCGVVGLKPSYGRVSRYGLVAFGSSLDCVGTLTRTVEDAAFLLEIMAGHDERDSTSMSSPVPAYRKALLGGPDLRGVRIGIPKEYFLPGIQPDVDRLVREAFGVLQSLGAQLQEISLPNTEFALPVYYLIAPAEASANLARYDGVRFGVRQEGDGLWETYNRTRGKGFGSEVKRRIMLGTYALSAGYYDAYYGQAQKVRTLIKAEFEKAFQAVDVIASPVTPTTAFRLGEKVDDPLSMYMEDLLTLPASLAGIPGLSVPCGRDSKGLPVGLQLCGPFLGEEEILQVGWAFQQVTRWHLEAPNL